MSRIKVLPDLLVNKIAAGEIIERPASVVKELVENALDAGAGHIAVTIEEGGRRLIRVADDGMGMSAEDLRHAVLPHATSKITNEDDLFHIATLGFRGEALASIGAVSHLRIVSRPGDAVEGAEIIVAAEKVESATAAGCRVGTTVEVRDLFFNVPARRKFLRTNATEVGHINEQVARLALAHRDIGFEINNNGRTTMQLAGGGDIRSRIAALYSRELADDLIAINREERGLHIEGYLAPPSQTRSTPAGQYTLLNGRFIRDKFVQHAVREAYRGLMEPNRYPVVFLFLTIDPVAVDVNVHPTKIEVRWQDSNLVHSQVLAAIREKFLGTDLTPAYRTGAPSSPRLENQSAEAGRVRADAAAFLRQVTPAQPGLAGDGHFGVRSTEGDLAPAPPSPADVPRATWDALYGPTGAPPAQPGGPPASLGAEHWSASRSALQIHNTYLVAETADGIVIIDQHALHERVMYEQIKAQIAEGALEAQRLLLPETLNVTPRQMALIQEHAGLLENLGIEAVPFGSDTVAIQSFPAILKDADAVAFLRDLLDRLDEKGEHVHTEQVIHALLDMMACKAAVKAGDPLTAEEIEALLNQKHLVEKSSNCPHGRPTTLRLSIADLEKQFKRR